MLEFFIFEKVTEFLLLNDNFKTISLCSKNTINHYALKKYANKSKVNEAYFCLQYRMKKIKLFSQHSYTEIFLTDLFE